MQPTHRYLTNLTPLRGFAAIWVFIFHFSEIVAKFIPDESSQIINKGYLMVDLFFIMSGFIMTHVYQRVFKTGVAGKDFQQFFVARFARVYPLHFFTLLLLVLLAVQAGIHSPIQDFRAIPTNLLLLHSFGVHSIFTWNVPSWSISAEWFAYMAFPFIILFLHKRKKLAMALMCMFIVLAYIALMYWLPRVNFFDPGTAPKHNLDVTYDYGFLRGLAGFLSGILVHKLYETGWSRKIFQLDLTALIVLLAVACSMHLGLNDGITVILFAAVVFSFSFNNQKLHRICNCKSAEYLGKISYSIYMVQMFVFIPVFRGAIRLPGLTQIKNYHYTGFWNGMLFCFAFLAAVLVIATFTYYTIEKPCRKYFNRKWGKERMPVYA